VLTVESQKLKDVLMVSGW